MELRQIRHLLEIVRCGGFTRAAAALHAAQPTLSMSIRKLEQELGVTLLDRSEHKVTLTSEGQAFLARAQVIDELIRGLTAEMRELRGLERGEVKIGIPGMLATHFFPPIITDFRAQFPGLRLLVYGDGARKIQEMVIDGELDVGIVARRGLPDTLAFQPLLREEVVACVGRGHHLAERRSVTFEELALEPLCLLQEGHFQRALLVDELSSRGLSPRVVFETNHVRLLAAVTADGGGATTLLRMAAAAEPRLVPLSLSPRLYVEAGVAWRVASYVSRAAQAFIDFLGKMKPPPAE